MASAKDNQEPLETARTRLSFINVILNEEMMKFDETFRGASNHARLSSVAPKSVNGYEQALGAIHSVTKWRPYHQDQLCLSGNCFTCKLSEISERAKTRTIAIKSTLNSHTTALNTMKVRGCDFQWQYRCYLEALREIFHTMKWLLDSIHKQKVGN